MYILNKINQWQQTQYKKILKGKVKRLTYLVPSWNKMRNITKIRNIANNKSKLKQKSKSRIVKIRLMVQINNNNKN